MTSPLDRRPIVVVLAGPSGAGKTTFYQAHLAGTGLRFVNTDRIAAELELDVLTAAEAGHTVVVCFIGVSGPDVCEQRVSMRVSQGGHDVPDDRLRDRYPRTLANLRAAIARLPHVIVYDNEDLAAPCRRVAETVDGTVVLRAADVPDWLRSLL